MSKPAAKPGLLSRLFGGGTPAPKPGPAAKQVYKGPAKDEAESRKLRATLAAQIRELRAKLPPQLLKLAEKVAKKGPPVTDQERATLAIELFLAQRKDGGDFAAKLKERIEERKRKSN